MARITEVALNGFKAQRSADRLSGLDLFTGANGIGKSARLEAASLAVLGYVPGRGRKADDTMALAMGDTMSVGLTLGDGFSCVRSFERKTSTHRRTGETTVKITETVTVSPSAGEANDTERKARIAAELGSFGIHLDFSEFLALSPAKRREFLYGLVSGAEEWTRARVEELLRRRLLTGELQENNPDAYSVMGETIDEALDEWKDGLTVQDGVTAMLEWVKVEASYWNSRRRDAEGAVRQLAELKNQLNATDRDIAERKGTLENMREELTSVTAEIARAQEIKASWDARQRRLESLRQELERLEQTQGCDTRELEDRFAAEVESLTAQIVEPRMDDGDEFEVTAAELRAQIEAANKEREEARRARATAAAAVETLRRAAETASSAGGLCVINKLIKCDKDFTPFVAHVKARAAEQSVLKEEASRREQAIATQLVSLLEAERALKDAETNRLRAISERQRENERLRKAIVQLENEKNSVIRTVEKEAARRSALADEIVRLENEPVRPVPETDILEKQVAGLRAQIAEMQAAVEEQEKARVTLTSMQGAMLETGQAEYKHNAAKNIQEALGPHGVQGELLKAGLEPLRAEIDGNLKAFGISNEFAFLTQSDRGAETFDFGWQAGDTFVSYDALSTGQRILVLVAMLTALLNRACPPVRLLTIDNIENLDSGNRRSLLEGLAALHADGKLDNVLAAGVIEDEPPTGWTVHRMDAAGEEAA